LDASGNGNDGIAFGAVPATNRFGVSNRCYSFDGTGQYIAAPASQLPSGPRTISVWFKANRIENRPAILGYGGRSCGDSFFLGLNHWGDQAYTVTTHCDVYTLRVAFTNAPVNNWYHWTVVMNGEGMIFYINGQRFGSRAGVSTTYVVGTQLGLGTIPAPYSGKAPYTDVNVGFLDGYLDDVRIYDRALSAAEVLELYNTEGGSGGAISPLITLAPVSQVIMPGRSCTFFAMAIGTPLPSYQWQLNGLVIPGATNASYGINATSATDIGWYSLVASNSVGMITSSAASLALFDLRFDMFDTQWLAAAYLNAPTGSTYRIEATAALAPANWTTLTNVSVITRPSVCVDFSSATNNQQFYRALPQ
jgi:hypothetical protein